MSKVKPTQIAILQTLTGGNRNLNTYAVNGFPSFMLTRVRSDIRTYPGFEMKMEEIIVLHHYFLRPGKNQITGEYALGEPEDVNKAGSQQLTARVVSTAWPIEKRPGEPFDLLELTTFQSPMLSRTTGDNRAFLDASFDWKPSLPAWGWTHGIAIQDLPATRSSLYQAYVRFHRGLAALRSAPPAIGQESPFISATRATMTEFIQACEMRKAHYHLLEDLTYAAIHLSTPDIVDWANRKAEVGEWRQPNGIASENQLLESQPPLDQDGNRMTWLTLEALPAEDNVSFEIFADGTLARLSGPIGRPMIVYQFNGQGGRWGIEQFTPFIKIHVWFRRDADGGWAVDGLWSMKRNSPAPVLSVLMKDDSCWGAE